LGKKNRKLNTDVLYYSNRGRNSTGVIFPRRHLIEKWLPTDVTVVVDISGSVSTEYVERVINAIVDANSGIDLKNSHIIFCDTQVTSDEILSRRTKNVYSGGGTDIAVGIKYAVDKYVKKTTDKLIVISDFEDNLTRWIEAAHSCKGQCYAIGYNVHNDEKFDPKSIMTNYLPSNEAGQMFCKRFKTLFIQEVIKE
jgi:uncharacterized protein with von Willebrand factor type A (vWA) domain